MTALPARTLRHPGKLAQRAAWCRKQGYDENAERIEKLLHNANRCRCCGRTLTDPDSQKLGIGPDCVKKGSK